MARSTNEYDWLGEGLYFWENDPHRAWEWAENRKRTDPSVIGAVIDYGVCLNLLEMENVEILSLAHATLKEVSKESAKPTPENKKGFPGDIDRVKRSLDCAVVNLACEQAEKRGRAFDTVRAMFPEGEPAYPEAGFRMKTHVQLCVREPKMILGYFLPIDPNTGKQYDWSNLPKA